MKFLQRISPSILLSMLLVACTQAPGDAVVAHLERETPANTEAAPSAANRGDRVEGLRVATRVGCNGCHGKDASGKVFQEDKEQGRIVAPNLTQRRTVYDDAGLAALLHEGKTHDGHFPWGMPILMFQHLSDREVRDITAWLRAIPAVDNPDLPAGKWSGALSKSIADGTNPWLEDMKADPGNLPLAAPPTDPLALGRHLAMTSCPECHGRDLNGFEGDDAPSLIVAKAYTPENFARLMRTGITASGKESASGLMTQMGRNRFPAMTDNEVKALKLYLDAR